jgi:hypothetical protein
MDKARQILRLACVGLFVASGLVVSAAPASAAPAADIDELRSAIDEANADPGNETIDLVANTTYAIAGDDCELAGDDDDANVAGDLDVFLLDDSSNPQDLTIQTPSGAPAIIEVSCPLTRAIEVVNTVGETVTVAENPNVGTLTLSNVIVRGGRAPDDGAGGNGGGVSAPFANLVFTDVSFDDNRAHEGIDGNDDIPDGSAAGNGGAVALTGGTMTVTGSTFTNNHAGKGGTGWTNTCDVPFEIPAGRGGSGGSGGAIVAVAFDAPIEMSIETSTFSGNTAGDGGNGGDGTPAACNVPGFGGDGGPGGDGGAISVSQRGSTFSIGHSAFSQNSAGDGGAGGDGAPGADAVAPQGDVTATASGSPGAVGGAGGDGGSGGGVSNFDNSRGLQAAEPTPDRVIANSTFESNGSGNGGGGGDGGNGGAGTGADPDGAGGNGGAGGCGGTAGAITDVNDQEFCLSEELVGIEQVEGALQLVHLTITENGTGGAGGNGGAAGTGGADGTAGPDGNSVGGSISSSDLEAIAIVVGTSDEDANDCNYPEIVGGPLFVESSFSTDDSCGFGEGSVQPFAAFALSALGDHGGPTETRVPLTGSVLIDVVPAADCTVADDQRLFARPQGAGCEVGAVEVSQPVTLAATKVASAASVPVGSPVTFTMTVKNTGTGTPKAGVTVGDPNCSAPALTGGDANNNGTLDPGETWSYTCSATPAQAGTFTNTVTFTVVDAQDQSVGAQATVTVDVTAPSVGSEETARGPLARSGANSLPLVQIGAGLLGVGTVLVLKRPFGRHYRKRAGRKSRGRHFAAR